MSRTLSGSELIQFDTKWRAANRSPRINIDRNLRINIVVRGGGLRDAPNREYREKSILLDVTYADPQGQIHLRGGSADHDGSAAFTSEACANTTFVRDMTCVL